MSKKANPVFVGVFVLAAIALAVAGVVVFGSGRFFTERTQDVLYFEGDVGGLQVGAPVTFRGVRLGSVTDIQLLVDPGDFSFRTRVLVETEPHRLVKKYFATPTKETPQAMSKQEREKAMATLIDRGLRARLKAQSLVTGLLEVELDLYPDTPAKLVGVDPGIQEIPAIPSSLEQAQKKLENLPLEELFNKTLAAVDGVRELVSAPELRRVLTTAETTLGDFGRLSKTLDAQAGTLSTQFQTSLKEAQAGLKDFRQLAKNANGRLGPASADISRTAESARQTLASLETLLASLKETTDNHSQFRYELSWAVQEVAAAARSVRTLTETIEANPNSLVWGKASTGEQR